MGEGARIITLQAENFKKLTAIDITPTSDVIEITGPNGAGKSSVLDCITAALKGGREIPEVPIKKGEDKGSIRMDCGEFVIVRSFTKKGNYLKIEKKDGSTVASPQKFLDELVGKISFDPLEFINNNTPAKQREVLLSAMGIDVDKFNEQEKRLKEERTVVGRMLKQDEAALSSLPPHQDTQYDSEVSVKDLLVDLNNAEEFNRAVQKEADALEQIKVRGMAMMKEAKDLRARAEKMEVEVIEMKADYDARKSRLMPMNDTSTMKEKIANAEKINEVVRGNRARVQAQEKVKKNRVEYDTLDKKIADVEKARQDAFRSCKMPVDGLSFGDAELMYKDVPLAQASDAEKLVVSLSISMALNPKMRVLRIKDGSLLDSKSRKIIWDMVKEKGFQLWLEKVDDSGKVGIYIEEGMIKAVAGKEEKGWVEQGGDKKAECTEKKPQPMTDPTPPVNENEKTEGGTDAW